MDSVKTNQTIRVNQKEASTKSKGIKISQLNKLFSLVLVKDVVGL